MQVPESVNEDELDALAVRILKLTSQYIICKANIENHIRSGCLDLAKARYIVGNRNISSLQLPSEDAEGVVAKFKVSSTIRDDRKQYKGLQSDVDSFTQRLQNLSVGSDDSKKQVKRFSNEPLKWFGFLVPQSLRQSKNTFENCLEIVIECANVQSELVYCMDKYRTCRKLVKCD